MVGASGYGGAEIVRLLHSHPVAKVTTVTSGRSAGRLLCEECPWLGTDLVLQSLDPSTLEADFVFLCQENGFAMDHIDQLLPKARIIDLSADFRLQDIERYARFYGRVHPGGQTLREAVYGLPELTDRTKIQKASLVANPGCYPTASLLALMPLIEAKLVSGVPIIDAKSGVSGAGRSKKETDYLFSELAGGFKAYAVTGHRHTPEIEQMAGQKVRFTPHLIPAPRGIHSTVHVPLTRPISRQELHDLYRERYKNEAFVRVQESPPSTKQVLGSNRCVISADVDQEAGFAVICSVIDNLVKGAAGQAIQNMNLMAGIPEGTGLPKDGVWP